MFLEAPSHEGEFAAFRAEADNGHYVRWCDVVVGAQVRTVILIGDLVEIMDLPPRHLIGEATAHGRRISIADGQE